MKKRSLDKEIPIRNLTKILGMILLYAVTFNMTFSQNRINPNFKYKIKGEKSEYNAKDSYTGPNNRYIDISNTYNTYGTDRYPEYVEDRGGGMCTRGEYIQIYKIFKDAVNPKDFQKLFLTKDILAIYVVYYPGGNPFEVRFSLRGDTLEKIPMDCFNNIEEEIKRSHKAQRMAKITDRYMLIRYDYYFGDIDERKFNGERTPLSKLGAR